MVSAVLIIGILSVTDKKNSPPPPGLLAVSLFILVLGIGTAMGMNTSYAANPARDLGPRILTAMVGYGLEGKDRRTGQRRWTALAHVRVQSLAFGTSTGYGAPSSAPCLVCCSVRWCTTS
jgi:glycerol uptake facilitator-like aquaporin